MDVSLRLYALPVLLLVGFWLPCCPRGGSCPPRLESTQVDGGLSNRGHSPLFESAVAVHSDPSFPSASLTPFCSPKHLTSFLRGRPLFLSRSLPASAPPCLPCHPHVCLPFSLSGVHSLSATSITLHCTNLFSYLPSQLDCESFEASYVSCLPLHPHCAPCTVHVTSWVLINVCRMDE